MIKPKVPYSTELITFAAFIYYQVVYAIFWLFNVFRERKIVSQSSDRNLTISATKAVKLIGERKLTSSELIESYIKRIEEVNPIINAVVRPNFEEAREKAKEVDAQISQMNDEELKEFVNRHPLIGLPFTMKDSLCLKGKVLTSGVYNRKDTVVHETATVVQRLLDAGAIFLAYTNVPEVCMWIESSNSIYGTSNNPYDSRRTVGGSSGGEGTLNGAGASLFGVGSDIGGSIRIPSAFNGIFGFLTSSGVVPAHGHIPVDVPGSYKEQMARIGPMTRFAEDIRLLTSIMAGNNTLLSLNETSPLKNVKVYFAEGLSEHNYMEPLSADCKESMLKAVNHFEKVFKCNPHKIVLQTSNYGIDLYMASYAEDGDPSFPQLMTCPKGESTEAVNCLAELGKFFTVGSHHTLAAIIFGLMDFMLPMPKEYQKMLNQKRDKLRESLIELLGKDGLLFYPSFPTVAPFHNELLVKLASTLHTGIVNVLCLPAIQCPLGLNDDGLPIGVMIIGAPGSDNLLVSAAEELSRGFGGWVPPRK